MQDLRCGIYRHYKGGLYLVMGIGQHTETGEVGVVYVSLTDAGLPGPRLRIRPLSMFVDDVPDQGPRFTYMGHTADKVA